jgi:hypothetical protein
MARAGYPDPMRDRSSPLKAMLSVRIALAALVWMIATTNGWPQTATPPPSPPAEQFAPQQPGPQQPGPQPAAVPPGSAAVAPAPAENPGLFNEMGKALEKSLSILPTLKSAGETFDDLRDAAKTAGEGLSRLTGGSMAEGRIKCPVSANGAPDCKAAADKLCQAKGFKGGKSLSTDSAEACSAKVLIPGRTRKPDDCRTDNFVIRALCQ